MMYSLSVEDQLVRLYTALTPQIIIGLGAAIRMRQLAEEKNLDLSVCLIEKGA